MGLYTAQSHNLLLESEASERRRSEKVALAAGPRPRTWPLHVLRPRGYGHSTIRAAVGAAHAGKIYYSLGRSRLLIHRPGQEIWSA